MNCRFLYFDQKRCVTNPFIATLIISLVWGHSPSKAKDIAQQIHGRILAGGVARTAIPVQKGQTLYFLVGLEGLSATVEVKLPLQAPKILEMQGTELDLQVLELTASQTGTLTVFITASEKPQCGEGYWWATYLSIFGQDQQRSPNPIMEWLAGFNQFQVDRTTTEEMSEAVPLDFLKAGFETEAMATASFYAMHMGKEAARDLLSKVLAGTHENTFPPLRARLTFQMGILSGQLGFFADAPNLLTKAAELWEPLGMAYHAARAYRELGKMHAIIKDLDFAESAFHQALVGGSPQCPDYWLTKLELGWVARHRGQFDEATRVLDEVLVNAQRLAEPYLQVEVCDRLGSVHALAGRFEEGERAYFRELNLIDRFYSEKDNWRAIVYSNLANLYQAWEKDEKVFPFVDRALANYSKDAAQEGKITLLGIKAKAYRRLGKIHQALEQYELLISQAEALRAKSAHGPEGLQLYSSLFQYIDGYFEYLWELHQEHPKAGYDRRAFLVAEGLRARDLYQRASLALNAKKGSADLLNRISQFGGKDAMEPQEQFEDKPSLFRPKKTFLGHLSRDFLQRGHGLLAYYLGEKAGFWWLLKGKRLEMGTLPSKREIEKKVTAFLEGIDLNSPLGKLQRAEDGLALSEMILPRQRNIAFLRHLTVVPDGFLYKLPFAALPLAAKKRATGKNRLLAEGPSLAYLPSASLGPLLRKEANRYPETRRSILAVTDPVFSSGDPRIDPRYQNPQTIDTTMFPRLVQSATEYRVLKKLSGGIPFRSLAGMDATLDRFLSLSPDEDHLIHLATHAICIPEQPGSSGLLFTLVDARGNLLDGYWRSDQIARLRLRADLVVLSACRTADGSLFRGEGVVGLARAFLQAGAGGVVASLWDVDDGATALLMTHFYEALAKGENAASALRAAQIRMAKHPIYSAPKYWAGFSLIGDPRKIF